MNMKIVGVTIGIFVAIVLLGGILVPVVNDALDGYDETFTNTGSGNVKVAPIEKDMTITYDGSTWDYNGTSKTLVSMCAFIFDNGFMYHGSDPTQGKIFIVDSDGVYDTKNFKTYTAIFDKDDKTVEFSGVDSTDANVSYSTTFEWAYVPDTSGTYICVDSNFARTFKINSMNDIHTIEYNNGVSSLFSSVGTTMKVNGVAQGDLHYTTTPVSGYANLSEIHVEKTIANSGLYFTYNGTNYSVHYTVLPYSVEAHLQENDGIVNVYAAIVPIVLVSLILAVVVVVFRSRD